MTTSNVELEIDLVKQDRRGRRITLPERRAALVAGYRSSGLTMAQYATAEGIRRHTLAKWVYLHDQRAGAGNAARTGSDFAQVNMVPAARPSWASERGVRFCEQPREEAYGTVVVFEDLYGNRWDLLQTK